MSSQRACRRRGICERSTGARITFRLRGQGLESERYQPVERSTSFSKHSKQLEKRTVQKSAFPLTNFSYLEMHVGIAEIQGKMIHRYTCVYKYTSSTFCLCMYVCVYIYIYYTIFHYLFTYRTCVHVLVAFSTLSTPRSFPALLGPPPAVIGRPSVSKAMPSCPAGFGSHSFRGTMGTKESCTDH